MTYPQSKLSTFFTELVCIALGLMLSLMWIIIKTIGDYKHFSFDLFYTVTNGCQFQTTKIISQTNLDPELNIAVTLSAVVIIEMVAAVIVLNIAYYKARVQIRGQQVLPLGKRIITLTLIYVITIIVSFPLCVLEEYINWNKSEIFLAIWFPLLNQCNLFVLYAASTDSCMCQQRKNTQATDDTDEINQTNPSSHPLDQPSHTTFPIPYTGGFTDITEKYIIRSSGVNYNNTGEMSPLLRPGRQESSTYSV